MFAISEDKMKKIGEELTEVFQLTEEEYVEFLEKDNSTEADKYLAGLIKDFYQAKEVHPISVIVFLSVLNTVKVTFMMTKDY